MQTTCARRAAASSSSGTRRARSTAGASSAAWCGPGAFATARRSGCARTTSVRGRGSSMPALVLGPVLRYVDETEATVWVETDAPCTVAILGHEQRTFHVHGHHYALVHVDGLEPGSVNEYEVHLDGERHWPEEAPEGFPPSVIRTPSQEHPARIAFGSCRVAAPHEPPYALAKDDDDRG